ncbi:MAG: EAL domain-containing protein [Methylotetracoccus sp.]|nr:EAL domain-containing protein [Methylotetracoccus sp.]
MLAVISRVRKATTRSLSTKYALLFALLVVATVTVVLVSAGMITFGQSEAVRYQVLEAVANSQALNEERELRRTGAYLSQRLRAPLARRDIKQVEQQIEEVETWLPIATFVIADAEGRILTDGTVGNRRRMDKISLPEELLARKTAMLVDAQGKELQFAVGDSSKILGYGKISLTGSASGTALEALDLRLYQVWNSHAAFLIGIGAIALALVLCVAVVLIFILSRSLANPLREMIRAAQDYAAGNMDTELPVRSDDELGQLARALNAMAADLKKKGGLLTRAQEIANLGSWEWDIPSKQLSWSRQALRILGYRRTRDDPSFEQLLRHLARADRARFVRLLRHPESSRSFAFDCSFRRNDGTLRLIRVRGQRNPEKIPGRISWAGTVQDVTEQKAAEDKLDYLANYDTLTGLPNRHRFQHRLQQAIAHAQQQGSRLALLFLDLDRFKGINDALGHAAGDDVLKLAATRLRQTIRDSDTVARLGGDEFTIILQNIGDRSDVVTIAQRIVATVSETFTLAGETDLSTSCSVGITLYPDDGLDLATLLKNADAAMYRSKAEGRGHYRFYMPEMNREAQERLTLENQLRTAVRNKDFALHYQPQLSLRTGELRGAEALLRWRTEVGLIPPNKFIPVLEQAGLIQDLTAWIIESACRQVRSWHDSGSPGIRIAINLSARQFQQRDLALVIDGILRRTGVAPKYLELEITESVLLDHDAIHPIARELVAMGLRLTIDDFGTGYCSLSYLKELSAHALKIDRSFVHDIPADQDDCAISSAIINLSSSLGLEVVAEGVETAEQWAFLRLGGCNLMQGYFAAEPLAPGEFKSWLETQCRRVGDRYFWGSVPPTAERPLIREFRASARHAVPGGERILRSP